MVLFPGKAYDEIKVGDSFGSAMTVTETHLVLASGLFGDLPAEGPNRCRPRWSRSRPPGRGRSGGGQAHAGRSKPRPC